MSIRRTDENGIYREVDTATGRFVDSVYAEEAVMNSSRANQIEHQTVATTYGRVVDPDEFVPEVVDENGIAVVSQDIEELECYIKESISVDQLMETFHVNSHTTLLKLLALQDNKHPLKKGGISIAYRTDALIMHCKMSFDAAENIVFDAILGVMSSFPENEIYRIEPKAFEKYMKYQSDNTVYKQFKSGTEKLTQRHLVFEGLGPDGDDDIIVPWFDILRYHKKKGSEPAYIEFRPSDFFKDLALCSQLVHGAYGSLEVTSQLRGKYTIALYWFLENRKRYKAYPQATPGIFDMTVDEIKHQFSMPATIKPNDIERRLIKPAYESINSINECDFTFEYEILRYGNKIEGVKFLIREKKAIAEQKKQATIVEDTFYTQMKTVLDVADLGFSENDVQNICSCAKRNSKTVGDMFSIIAAYKNRVNNDNLNPVEDSLRYICSMIENGVSSPMENEKKPAAKKNAFNNFSQREYDMEELEKKMLS